MKLKGLGFAGLVLMIGCASSSGTTTAPGDTATAAGPSTAASTPAVATADRQAVAHALALYAAHDYEAAALAFERAYEEGPDTSLLLARAQSLRLAGKCDQARILYDQFLAGTSDPTYRNAVEHLIDGCKTPLDPSADSQVAAR